MERPAQGSSASGVHQYAGRFDEAGRGREERASGFVAWRRQNFFGRARFDDAAVVHDGDLIGKVGGHRKIVGDEEIGQTERGLQIEQEIGDLGLYGAIEGGERFIQNDELWLERQGAGDGEALFLSAAELVGSSADHFSWDGDAIQKLQALSPRSCFGEASLCTRKGSLTISRAVQRGLSELAGS